MPEINLTVPLTTFLQGDNFQLYDTSVNMRIHLGEGITGENTESIQAQIGNVGGRQLFATFTWFFEYDNSAKTLVLFSSRLPANSPFASKLSYIHSAFDRNQFCRHKTSGFDDSLVNNELIEIINVTPTLNDALLRSVQYAQEQIISQCIIQANQLGIHVLVRTPPEFERNSIQVVYQEGLFLEVYNHNNAYGNNTVTMMLESVYAGEINIPEGTEFSNVIGSTNDPRISNLNWLDLWQRSFDLANNCTSLERLNGENAANYCDDDLVGGHVILGREESRLVEGSKNVFIVPICRNHNRPGNGFMTAVSNTKGIALHKYLRRE